MFGMASPQIIGIAIAILVIVGLIRRGKGGVGPTLVLRKFKLDESPSASMSLDIIGRAPGFLGWLLTILGFDAETGLRVTGKEILFKRSSLFGQIYQVVPLPSVSGCVPFVGENEFCPPRT